MTDYTDSQQEVEFATSRIEIQQQVYLVLPFCTGVTDQNNNNTETAKFKEMKM